MRFRKNSQEENWITPHISGVKNIHTGKIDEVMLIKNQADLDVFKKMYGIDGEIEKDY